jgi:hypothetical protein
MVNVPRLKMPPPSPVMRRPPAKLPLSVELVMVSLPRL